ncbi:MAG: class I tRNA ligase family protein, partial [Bifidobacteriaceae bacterium]|nr:class I tRNA ligase family protein [Bifidobacteriaceae bacterium]
MTADTTIPAFRYTNQIAGRIEAKWQTEWEQTGAFWAANPEPPYLGPDGQTANGKSPYFVMDMFPYPSGAGLHVGHPLGYIATDLMARYHRQKGENVLYSLGFDAFGLPAELYAIQTGRHPRETTVENIEIILKQLKRLGLSHDERRRFATIDPDYVKWSQWIFLQIFNSYFDEDQQQARPISELIAKF